MIPRKQRFIEQLQDAFGLTPMEAEAIAHAVFDMQAQHPAVILAMAIDVVNEKDL